MNVFDWTAEERERWSLPKNIARSPEPSYEGMTVREASDARYRWQNSWEVLLDTGPSPVQDAVKRGMEVRPIQVGRAFGPGRPLTLAEQDERRRAHQDQVARWADGFITDTGTPGLIWPEDREMVLAEVARRLREATADGFLLRALEASP